MKLLGGRGLRRSRPGLLSATKTLLDFLNCVVSVTNGLTIERSAHYLLQSKCISCGGEYYPTAFFDSST